jgi:hypothetical protein
MEKRYEFCKMIIERKLNFDQILFTDECNIDLSPYTNDWSRLEPDIQKKIRHEEPECYTLINRPQKNTRNNYYSSRN